MLGQGLPLRRRFPAGPDGTPLWVSQAEPGGVHDLRAARPHALPALHPAAAEIGIRTPRRPHPDAPSPLHAATRACNQLVRSLRVLGERAAARLNQRRRALRHITLSPGPIGAIAQAALALNNAWR